MIDREELQLAIWATLKLFTDSAYVEINGVNQLLEMERYEGHPRGQEMTELLLRNQIVILKALDMLLVKAETR